MTETRSSVTVYTDGSALGNPGPGGCAAILRAESQERVVTHGYRRTTDNRMELMGVIAALEALTLPCRVTVRTDSKDVCDALTRNWLPRRQAASWLTYNRKPVANADLWKRLITASAPHDVRVEWIPGHRGHALNERADRLALDATQVATLDVDEGFEARASGSTQPPLL